TERFGDPDADFAAYGRDCAVACPHETEGGFLHALCGEQDLGALRRGADPIDMAGDQNGSQCAFQIVDLAAKRIGRESHAVRGGTDAAAAGEFEEGANRLPIGAASTRT